MSTKIYMSIEHGYSEFPETAASEAALLDASRGRHQGSYQRLQV